MTEKLTDSRLYFQPLHVAVRGQASGGGMKQIDSLQEWSETATLDGYIVVGIAGVQSSVMALAIAVDSSVFDGTDDTAPQLPLALEDKPETTHGPGTTPVPPSDSEPEPEPPQRPQIFVDGKQVSGDGMPQKPVSHALKGASKARRKSAAKKGGAKGKK